MAESSSNSSLSNDGAALATLGIRVSGLETRLTEISTTLQNISASFSAKIEERSKTPWAIIIGGLAVLLSVMGYLDQAKLSPMKERDSEILQMIKEIQANIKDSVVPIWVNQREWQNKDAQFKAAEERTKLVEENMSQRIKRMEDLYGSTWSVRDAITTFQQRIDRLEHGAAKN